MTDAAVLSTKVDGVVLIVKSGETSREVIERSRMLLDKVNANLLGVLVNGVNVNMMYGSYYQYYQYYYYSGDGRKRKHARKSKMI